MGQKNPALGEERPVNGEVVSVDKTVNFSHLTEIGHNCHFFLNIQGQLYGLAPSLKHIPKLVIVIINYGESSHLSYAADSTRFYAF